MPIPPLFQEDLINRYDKPGPRYTSYPPATEFHNQITESDYRDWARLSNEEPIPKPLSLYFHIPFCSSICYYCACNKVITKRKERATAIIKAPAGKSNDFVTPFAQIHTRAFGLFLFG